MPFQNCFREENSWQVCKEKFFIDSLYITDHSKKPAESKLDDLKKTVIIVVVVAALLTVIATALLVFRQRKIRQMHEEEKKEAAKDTELFTNITTVRDRIREDSAPNPLMAALAQLSPEQKPPQCHLGKVAYVKDLGQGQFGKVFQGKFKIFVRLWQMNKFDIPQSNASN